MICVAGLLLFVTVSVYAVHGSIDAHTYFHTKLINDTLYNKRERPGLADGSPTVVGVDLFVSSINSIDEITMDFKVNMFLRQRWQDKRLSFKDNPDLNVSDITIDSTYINSMWKPDLFFKNELTKGSFHDVTVPNILLKLSPDGSILFSQRISTQLACNMKLEKYPLDNQTCYIEMESYGFTTEDLIFQWSSDGVAINHDLQLPEFNITQYTLEKCTVQYSTGAFSCIRLALDLSRLQSYYFVQVYVPTILIVILSWVSFWIDYKSVPARISVGLLTVLTITTKSSSINSKLPKVSYIKAIDVWMFTCTVFVFAALLEYSLVNVLARRQQEMEEKQKKQSKAAEEEQHIRELQNKKNGVQTLGTAATTKEYKPFFAMISSRDAMAVEKLSRVIFPTSFAVFNLFYWIVYCVLLEV